MSIIICVIYMFLKIWNLISLFFRCYVHNLIVSIFFFKVACVANSVYGEALTIFWQKKQNLGSASLFHVINIWSYQQNLDSSTVNIATLCSVIWKFSNILAVVLDNYQYLIKISMYMRSTGKLQDIRGA